MLSSGCVSPADLAVRHVGFGECARLDREPFPGEGEAECAPGADPEARAGTLHRQPDRRLDSDVLPVSIPAFEAARLPVADCLWGSSSSFGNGDEFGLQWDAAVSHRPADHDLADDTDLYLSACRLDPIYERVSLFESSDNAFNITTGTNGCNDRGVGVIDFEDEELPNGEKRQNVLGEHKLTCDLYSRFFNFEVRRIRAVDDGFGSCGTYDGTPLPIPGFSGRETNCAAIEFAGERGTLPAENPTFTVRIAPRTDGQIMVAGQAERVLSPAIHTVVDSRSIARLLDFNASGGEWQTPVMIDGPAGQQRWRENFLDSIRVDTVRVFAIPESGSSDREYLSLEDAELQLVDPVSPQANINCAAEDGVIDVRACNISATPTYRSASLSQVSAALPAPLLWRIVSNEINDDGRVYYMEFDLISSYRTRQAALMAEVSTVDFGGLLPHDYASTFIRFTNVGYGPATIDGVSIDPNYGQPYAFEAKRLDDPQLRPLPIYAEPTGIADEYRFGLEPWPVAELLYQVDDYETHAVLRHKRMHGQTLNLFDAEVRYEADTPVLAQAGSLLSDPSDPQRNHFKPIKIYTEWQTPFVVRPGESRTVQVRAFPSHIGEQKGRLVVSGYATDDPSIALSSTVELEVYGRVGPALDVLPSVVNLPHPAGIDTNVAIFSSHGDSPVEHDPPEIIDSNSIAHVGESQFFEFVEFVDGGDITPGNSIIVRVRYEPGCFFVQPTGGYHQAMLRMTTSVGEVDVALRGNPARWAEVVGNCGPQ